MAWGLNRGLIVTLEKPAGKRYLSTALSLEPVPRVYRQRQGTTQNELPACERFGFGYLAQGHLCSALKVSQQPEHPPTLLELKMSFTVKKAIFTGSIYLIDSREIAEEALCIAEQSLVVRTNHDVTDVPLGAERIKQQFLPVGQPKRRQHHKVILIAHQKSGNGQRLRGLICTC